MPRQDTHEIAGRAAFPSTRLSVIFGTRSANQEERAIALEIIAGVYWKPVYKYIRVKWRKSHEDAADLTQGFFAVAIEKGFFQPYDPARAKFRTFVRTCVDRFVANEEKSAGRLKRSGSVPHLTLDFAEAEAEFRNVALDGAAAIEEFFYREWARSLFALSVETLRSECAASGRDIHFHLFERYDLDDADESVPRSYASLAAEFGLAVTTVTNYLAYARRELRRIVLEKLREITPNEREFRTEAKRLLGIDTP